MVWTAPSQLISQVLVTTPLPPVAVAVQVTISPATAEVTSDVTLPTARVLYRVTVSPVRVTTSPLASCTVASRVKASSFFSVFV